MLAYLHYAPSGELVGLSLDWMISIFTIRNPHSALSNWKAPEQLEGEGIVMRLIQISRHLCGTFVMTP